MAEEQEKQEKQKKKKKKKKKEPLRPGYFETIAIALSISIAVVAGYDKYYASKIKLVDLTGFIKTQKALLKSGDITPEQWKKNLEKWDNTLEQEARKHPHQLFVLKDMVLKNGKEFIIK